MMRAGNAQAVLVAGRTEHADDNKCFVNGGHAYYRRTVSPFEWLWICNVCGRTIHEETPADQSPPEPVTKSEKKISFLKGKNR